MELVETVIGEDMLHNVVQGMIKMMEERAQVIQSYHRLHRVAGFLSLEDTLGNILGVE